MAERSVIQSRIEPFSDGWDALFASVDDLIRRRPSIATEDSARTRPILRECVDCGMCAVPIYRIALGASPGAPFERWLPQDSVAAPAFAPDQQVQPIELYKVGETYYVRDGNRRIASARARGQLFLRAHVIEYLIDAPARPADVLNMLVEQERAAFFRRYEFPDQHPAHGMRAHSLGCYHALAEHIDAMLPALARLSGESTQSALLTWYDRLFLPVARLIRRRDVLAYFPVCGEIELYLWAIYRHGAWDGDQSLRERLRLARRSIVALWIALRSQNLRPL